MNLTGENEYEAVVTLGVGPVSGRFKARVKLSDMDPPKALVLSGDLQGPLGSSSGSGHVILKATEAGTEVQYDYSIDISGKVVAIGGRMLESATRTIINQFFKRLTAQIGGKEGAGPDGQAEGKSFWQWLLHLLGAGK